MISSLAMRTIDDMILALFRFIEVRSPILTELEDNSHLLQRILESVEQRHSLHTLTSHSEQEAQACMTGICVGAMFRDDLVVCCEERSKWELFDLGIPLGANDDLVEETDICGREQSEWAPCI